MSLTHYAFPKSLRLRKRREFYRVSCKASKIGGKLLYIDYSPNNSTTTRLGITVTKRYGKSYERNRFKRLVREAFRLTQAKLPAGLDIIVKPRTYVKDAPLCAIQNELVLLLKQVRVVDEPRVGEP
ncbi:MAG: ribonuclease P protein component [Parachlamydiales bacterium]